MILTDNPIESKDADRLKRQPLAKKVAELVSTYQGKESFVIGIEGPWGSGKTSFINLVFKELNISKLIVVRFNPWNFGGQNELVADFFSTLSEAIGAESSIGKTKSIFKKYAGKLQVSASPTIKLFGVLEVGGLLNRSDEPLESARKAVDKALEKLEKRIVVVIDDIDRLDKTETRLIMKLVKMTANFPNTVFVLAYDRKKVADRLEEEGWPGDEYLKKIIQVSFNLPEPDRNGLNRILFNDLDDTVASIYGETRIEGDEEKRWGELVSAGLPELFKTIRDVKRFVSSLRLNWSIMGKDEISKVDFIAIEALRVTAPTLYSVIAANKSLFTATQTIYAGMRDESAAREAEYTALLEKSPEDTRGLTKAICMVLFPQLNRRSSYGHDWQNEWRKAKRICSEERFSFYFQLGIPDGAASETEVNNLVLEPVDTMAVSIERLSKEGRLRHLLTKLTDRIEGLDEAGIKRVILALWRFGWEADRSGIFDFDDAQTKIFRFTYFSVKKKISADRRDEFLLTVMKESNSLYWTVYISAFLVKEAAKNDPEGCLTVAQAERLKTLALEIIRAAAADGGLLGPNLAMYLYRLKEWGEPDEAVRYVEQLVSSQSGLLSLLRSFVTKVFSTAGNYKTLDKKSLAVFHPIDELERAVAAITDNQQKRLDEEDREAIQIFKNPREI